MNDSKTLMRELAVRELQRAGRIACDLEFDVAQVPMLCEICAAALKVPSPIRGDLLHKQQAIVARILEALDATAKQAQLCPEGLFRGETFLGTATARCSVTAAYIFVAHLGLGARTLRNSSLFWLGAVIVNRFAARIAGEFPTLADQLVNSLNPANDSRIPEEML